MVNFVLAFFLAYGLCFPSAINSVADLDFEFKAESAPRFSYDRIDEVKRQCRSVLSSASELKLEDISRVRGVRKGLGFQYGDWNQDSGASPILPFDESTNPSRNSLAKPVKLASFWVTDLDLAHRSKKYVGVNGVLMLGITVDNGLPRNLRFDRSRQFELWPGHTQLKISLQGVYFETKENDGERVMCMLGETMLPSRESDSDTKDPWKWVRDHSPGTPPLLQDDQILVLIRYPKRFTLTKRVIEGEMTSLNQKTSLKYFDKVHILSQLGESARYEFSSEDLVSKACDSYPYKNDSFLSSGIDVYNGTGFCSLLERVSNGVLTIVPNWKCNSTDEYCGKLGPFPSDEEIRSTNGSFKDVKLYMQGVHCQETAARSQADFLTRVSAVFRAVHPTENEYIAAWRSAPNNMTVSVEGIWKPSSGQLCTVGCVGKVDAEGSSCNIRLCLYIPITFSVRQRSILVGTFFSINGEGNSFFPLSFEKLVQATGMPNYVGSMSPRYSYSKIEAAGAILEKNEPFSFGKIIKKSFLQYPKLEDAGNFFFSHIHLAGDLTIHTSAFSDARSKFPAAGTNLGMDILSLGPFFQLSLNSTGFSTVEQETPYRTKAEYTEKQLLLNVSAQISLTGEPYGNLSVLYLEGLYDENAGKMYLVGCRDVRASWKILFDSNDLEAGLDCLIEVIVSYPPTKSRWLADPTARVSISSQRPEDDPLYFKPVKLRTYPIFYRKQREDILSRAGVEGILRILTLSFAIACITSQLLYARNSTVSLPFMSLVMLGVQALGYSLPLITGAEALFRRKASGSYEIPSYDLQRSQWLNVIDYTVKFLVLVCFLLTLRLCQKVWKSRERLLTRTPHEPQQVPSDRRVVLITMVLHLVGYIVILIVHSTRTAETKLEPEIFGQSLVTSPEPVRVAEFTGNPPVPRGWQTELGEYIGLVQDFFLLPQVIANVMWQIECQPLRKLYYIGITSLRLLPHIYDYITDPIPDPFIMGGDHEFVNPNLDFFSKFGDIAIPVTAILLAVIVFVQQRWDYDRLSQALIIGRFRILPPRSIKYERLQNQPTEAELVSAVGVNGNRSREKEYDDEE
ncbi:PREDICTED: uncharacterized protein LOC104818053 isoform X2 [Tarenaya hassleriana]|uniref:uncharacterized protein LOC104818053 isoform X1 n=1 Tax=Tarenaya hassleriana TaxID=28532 RepID=UPI00053C969D|nr:PREDICTED: uncharacterized protein LOC104818053 isoform X1 [Tarenaya hassleriana]XP_010545799.1 PREDICTED: uncharacterized protein LOC104818053 isoform X2 [Tarenaya hassleriana]